MIEESVFWLGGGLFFGYVAGYAFKKLVKIAAVIVGAFILVMAFLSYKGWITANYDVIANQSKDMVMNTTQQVINEVSTKLHTHNVLETQATPIAGIIGFVIGLGIGLFK